MGLQEEHDEYVKSLQIDRQQSKQKDPKIRSLDRIGKTDETVTAESIKQEAEAPIHSAAALLLLRGKMKYAGTMGKHVEGIRQRYQKFPFRGGDAPLVDVKATKPNYKGILQNVWNHKNTGTASGPNFELMGTNPADTSRWIPKYAQSAKIYLGDQPPTSTFMTTTGGEPGSPGQGQNDNRKIQKLKRIYGETEDAIEFGNSGDQPAPASEWNNDPRKDWGTREGKVEARVRIDQFEDAVLTEQGEDTKNPWVYKPEVEISPRGTRIAKRKESGYKFNADLSAEWNAWSKSTQFLDELADKPGTAFVEHLVGKGERLNFFWNLPDGEGDIRSWRPGTRHSPNNTRIFYGDRQKKLKDATENLLYPIQENLPDLDRFIVDYDLPEVEPGESITVRKPTGDIVIRRVDGTIVGRLGDYHDVLYAPADVLEKALTTNINPNSKTNKFYIDPNTGNMKKAIRHWREKILLEKINLIIAEAPTTIGKTTSETYQRQSEKVMEDMTSFNKEYGFIPKPKGNTLDDQLKVFGKEYTTEMKSFLDEASEGASMLLDKVAGMTWTQLKKKYPQSKNISRLELVYKQLTPQMVQRLKQEQGFGGKGGTKMPPSRSLKDVLDEIDFHD